MVIFKPLIFCIIEINEQNIVLNMYEKIVISNLANGAIYIIQLPV